MKINANNSTLLGTVQDVNGTSVSVKLTSTHSSGLTFVDGQGYRIGQVGSFVRIPIGYIDLFGIVSQVGARSVPENLADKLPDGYRWLTVQLIGEGYKRGKFQRGISQYPTIEDEVHLVSEHDLAKIYGEEGRQNHLVRVGHIAGSESIDSLVDINKLITRHSAIVGTTGSGKSTTVAGLLNALSDAEKFPSSRIIVLDIHGEYGRAMKDRANIYKINPEANIENEKPLRIPFWALTADELLQVTFGGFGENSKSKNIVLEKIIDYKIKALNKYPKNDLSRQTLSVDSPVPFSLNQLWYDLYCSEFGTYYTDNGKLPIEENWAYEKDEDGNEIKGNPAEAIPPKFKKVKNVAGDPEKIQYLPGTLNITSQLENLGSKLRIPRFDFLLKPDDWCPELDGKVEKDLNDFIKDWIGSDKPITILDLSGVPPSVLNDIIGICLRIIYDGLFWSRNLPEGGRERPLLVVMEEAHSYLTDNFEKSASTIVQKIVKEGRKYGIGAMIVSQRPSEINPTILSQCGTFFSLRLSNNTDRAHIKGAITDNLDGLTDMLPILKTGEAIILGEAVKLPMRTLIEAPPKERRPDSQDPIVSSELPPDLSFNLTGGWDSPKQVVEDYDKVVEVWRKQNPKIAIPLKEQENINED
ncbi:MAG: ATP-binding protein [Bacteroidales bacterium]